MVTLSGKQLSVDDIRTVLISKFPLNAEIDVGVEQWFEQPAAADSHQEGFSIRKGDVTPRTVTVKSLAHYVRICELIRKLQTDKKMPKSLQEETTRELWAAAKGESLEADCFSVRLSDALEKGLALEAVQASLLVDVVAVCEACAWEVSPLLCRPAPTATSTWKNLATQVAWLLDDSKVINRVEVATEALCDVIPQLVGIATTTQHALQYLKGEIAEGEALYHNIKGVESRKMARQRSLAVGATIPLNEADQRVQDLVSAILRARREQLGDAEPVEIRKEHFEGVELPDEIKTVNQNLPPSVVCGVPHTQPSSALDAVSTLRGVVVGLMLAAETEAFNAGLKKLQAKKAKVSWGVKFGRGVSEYSSFILEHQTPWLSVASLLQQSPHLAQVLIAKNQATRIPKCPKGCVDFNSSQMKIREIVFDKITEIFRLYGAEPIDTPVFELKEVLTNKYGEDTKLIYDLKDQGGEQLGLRYDLTVPFARYCAANGIDKIKRYHIGKVYRRDEPQMAKGRYREFYQCDIDFAGPSDLMAPDAEILAMTIQVLDTMGGIIGDYVIRLSHRRLLDGIMQFCGVRSDQLRAISSAIDKLDKEPWEMVEQEMTQQKGLDPAVATRLKQFVTIKGTFAEVSERLGSIDDATQFPEVKAGLRELELLFKYLKRLAKIDTKVELDCSLARGLDYYTGLIYEAIILSDKAIPVGTIAAGGRYDKLIGMFSGKDIPAVGISLGVERIFRLIDAKVVTDKHAMKLLTSGETIMTNKADVFVFSIGDDLMSERIRVADLLRRGGVRVELAFADKVNMKKTLSFVAEQNIPLAVLFDMDEIQREVVQVREVKSEAIGGEVETGPVFHQKDIPLDGLVALTKKRLTAMNRITLGSALFPA